MALSKEKIDTLANYYLKHGFHHSTDEIAKGIGISHKTFFNRYKSKEESINIVLRYWYGTVELRFREKAQHCNHAVEELLQLIYEIGYLHSHESFFMDYLRKQNLFISDQAPFVKILTEIILNGISHYQFKEDVNVDLYVQFILNNLTHYNYQPGNVVEIISFLLSPIITDRSKALIEELDVTNFL